MQKKIKHREGDANVWGGEKNQKKEKLLICSNLNLKVETLGVDLGVAGTDCDCEIRVIKSLILRLCCRNKSALKSSYLILIIIKIKKQPQNQST